MSRAEKRIPNTASRRKSSIRCEPDFVDDFDDGPPTVRDPRAALPMTALVYGAQVRS